MALVWELQDLPAMVQNLWVVDGGMTEEGTDGGKKVVETNRDEFRKATTGGQI
ncbi:MAG: hypothetical protein J4F49_08810 [Rhodobacteraceae bacterium]|nr:hypothetical protein [Paracoccaceae bacterium]